MKTHNTCKAEGAWREGQEGWEGQATPAYKVELAWAFPNSSGVGSQARGASERCAERSIGKVKGSSWLSGEVL